MKKLPRILVAVTLCMGSCAATAQMPPGPPSPTFSGGMAKVFGANSNFTATLEMQTKMPNTYQPMSISGKLAASDGRARFEIDMSQAKGPNVNADAAAQMKAMGMDKMVMLSRPDKKIIDIVCPGLQSYVEAPMTDPDATKPASDFKLELTELGKETVAGHACVKSKAVITDNDGNKHEAIVWNAKDLKNFPIKIEQQQDTTSGTMTFSDIVLSKPDAGVFDPPAGYTKYDSFPQMIQQEMMKKYGGQGAPPPGGPPHP